MMARSDRGPRCECGALVERESGGPVAVMSGRPHACPPPRLQTDALAGLLRDALKRCQGCGSEVVAITIDGVEHAFNVQRHQHDAQEWAPRPTRVAPSVARPVGALPPKQAAPAPTPARLRVME